MPKTSYHFDVGNSSVGHIGFCARVLAESPEEAVAVLRELIPPEIERVCNNDPRIEYADVYFNPKAFTVDDIDEPD